MDLNALPFDAATMLAGLEPWVRLESPTYDAAAVNRMMDLVAHDLAIAGARIERIPGRMGLGDCLRARFPLNPNQLSRSRSPPGRSSTASSAARHPRTAQSRRLGRSSQPSAALYSRQSSRP